MHKEDALHAYLPTGVDALSRGHLGSGVQLLLRAADARRCAAALQLVGLAAEEALVARLGSYRAGPLQLPGGDELEALLEWLPGGGGGGGGSGAGASEGGEAAGEAGGGRGLTGFLVGVLKLSRAMGALAEARDANVSPGGRVVWAEGGVPVDVWAVEACCQRLAWAEPLSMRRAASSPRVLPSLGVEGGCPAKARGLYPAPGLTAIDVDTITSATSLP